MLLSLSDAAVWSRRLSRCLERNARGGFGKSCAATATEPWRHLSDGLDRHLADISETSIGGDDRSAAINTPTARTIDCGYSMFIWQTRSK